MIYLGSGEKGSYEYISGLLGEFTLQKRSSGQTYGERGSSSSNVDSLGRKLMTEDELRKMGKNKCIVFLAGEHPVIDDKYPTGLCKRFKKAVQLGDYKQPSRAVRNGMLLTDKKHIEVQSLNKEEVSFYIKQQEQGLENYIFLDKESFLTMDLEDEHTFDAENIKELMKKSKERIQQIEDQTEPEEKKIDLSFGSAYDWLNRYPLEPDQTEEIVIALEDGMTDADISQFFDPDLPAKKMNHIRRLLMASKRKERA